jgi:DNA-binding IclR family transcriptional regulator
MSGLVGDTGDGGVRSVGRAVDMLVLFDEHHPTRTLRELTELSGLPKTTVVRLLATLESRKLIAERDDGHYGLGAGFLRWVRLTQAMWQVNQTTRQTMIELVDELGETVNVYVRQGANRVSIAQEEGTATVRSVVAVGVPMPLTAGATAKVLLTAAPPTVFDVLAASTPGLDIEALRRQVSTVQEHGYAVTHGERELGASAVAAPILNSEGRVIAALSISGPSSRFSAELLTPYVSNVIDAAKRISGEGLGSVEAFL